ncbi:MAG: DUF1800 family protein [Verrucomicrobiota bacterium]
MKTPKESCPDPVAHAFAGLSIFLALVVLLPLSASAQVDLDSDSDGLLDAWEIQHFGVLDDPDGDPTDDPDGDGHDNQNECDATTDPLDRDSCFILTEAQFDPSNLEIEWTSERGKKYHAQLSSDFVTWGSISDSTGTTPYDFYGTGETIRADFNDAANPMVTGAVTREIWFDPSILGNLNNFKAYVDNGGSPLPPDGVEWRSSLKAPSEYGSNFGQRYRGFIVPKTSGDYTFYIAGRHQCEFWLDTTGDTTDAVGLQRECYLFDNNLTEEEDWDYLASQGLTDTQRSRPVALVAGQKYFLEIWQTHNGQWDHLAVGWELNGGGEIEVVPGDCLSPNTDFSDNNLATLQDAARSFTRVVTYGASSLGGSGAETALDTDGDGVDDATEESLDGFSPYIAQSASPGQSDAQTLTDAAAADPINDTITVVTTDVLAREDNGLIGSGIPRVKDVGRFSIRRSGSLAPVTIQFDVTGTSDTTVAGSASSNDYILETPTGTPLPSTGNTYAVTIPFGGDECIFEVRSLVDEVVEFPEQLTVTVPASLDYTVGIPSQASANIHDARDDPEFNKYYIATFSKDANAVTNTSASGATVLVLNGSNQVANVSDFFENLTSAQTNTHIHRATLKPDGITFDSGPVVESITDDGTETGTAIMGPVSNYTYLIEPRAGFTQQDLIDSLEFDNPKQGSPAGTTPLYNNKHTQMNGGGEIWAIYRRQPASELSPEAEGRIPPTPTIEPIEPVAEPDKLRREVARFLTQATFGPTEADIEELIYEIENTHSGDRIAAFDAWITDQWAVPQSLVRDFVHALDMQEFTLRGYFDPARNGAASPPPVAPTNWPSWPSQDISNFDSLNIATWQSPDADFPLTGAQENALDGPLGSPNHNNRRRAQWTIMVHGKDQLRQRVGFALSEITVISEELNNIRQHHIAASRWIDMLAENADDHFRELIEDVTYSPLMGKYLSHLQNSSEAASGVPPDENYAREIMQLFTIGLLQLWDDGFVKLDPTQFNILPTYTNDDIRELARVMTGMSWSTNSAANTNWDNPNLDRTNPPSGWYDDGNGNLWYSSRFNYPMAFYNGEHDNGNKTIAGGFTISNNGNADGRYTSEGDKDLRDVHNYFAGTQTNQLSPKTFAASWSTDPMVNHQNTPAFISRRLIQRLVTSNPSGPYIYRVAQVWRNTNGQLDEVVRAILLDPEARNLSTSELNPEYGKKKEPIVAWIQAIRGAAGRSRVTFDGSVISGDPVDFPNQTHRFPLSPTADGDLRNFDYPQTEIAKFAGAVFYDNLGELVSTGPGTYQRHPATTIRVNALDGGGTSALGQTPLKAPTVFNWFLPDYQPGGLIASFGLFAPEFQLTTESSVFQNINVFWTSHWGAQGFGGANMGGSNANADAAGYSTVSGTSGTNHTDDNVIMNYWAWIYRYENYPTIPDNGLNDEQDKVLQLIDDLDAVLFAGRYKLLYPINASDDGTSVQQGNLTHFPNRNPRETLLHYIADTYNDNASMSNQWNKVRAALYIMVSSPEFLIQK